MIDPSFNQSNSTPRVAYVVLFAIVGLAVALQWSRLPFRWNPVALAYAAYFHEFRHAINLAGVGAAFTTFVGLHPPAYSLFFWGLMELRTPAACWLASSGLFSVAAVPLVWMTARHRSQDTKGRWAPAWRGAAIAALVLAVSPHRNAYGLEINNYPLLVASTAAQLWAFAKMVNDPRYAVTGSSSAWTRPKGVEITWVLCTALSIWTHVLSIALPCSQLLLLLLLPETRQKTRRAITLMAGAAALCLPLLPGLLAGMGSDPINTAPGLFAALRAALLGFPGRYGSTLGAGLMSGLIIVGGISALRLPHGKRLVPLSWLTHGLTAGALIIGMVASGMAAAHQFPYYLVLLPAGALLVSESLRGRQRRLPRLLLGAMCCAALCLHGLALIEDARRGQSAWNSASSDRGLIELATNSWIERSSLLLLGFPQTFDDDKDALDPAFAFIPMNERITFAQPEVATLVPGDPNWGQPLRFEGERWLYTFTDFKAERVNAITDAALARGERVIVAAYNTDWAQREADELKAWATARGEPGRRAPNQLMFLLETSAPR